MSITPELLSGSADINSKYETKLGIVCDMGEGYGKWKMGPDEDIMPLIDVANIACGFHAGDFNIMAKTVKLAKEHGVKVGSHPGLPDLLGFGRRKWDIPADEVFNLIMYQTGALKAFLDAEGMPLNHIKAHGELFFYVARDEGVMRALMKAAKIFDVPVIVAKNKRIQEVAEEMGVDLIQELYVDVDYSNEGHLVPVQQSRPKNGEIIYDLVKTAALEDTITSVDNTVLNLNFGENPFLLCLHSDMPTALDNVKASRRAIDEVNAIKYTK
ncbi:CYFA0S09e00826g1_1 [Cyberlindnera fabianii]|uniref:CYFA0S09e00826g1_1 n=1 Tax=Cyberlindnera fabianii TaxID=36022 RepID=A0A061AYJ2_CYBFA|nr:CYFA0S09e00826g1_1 [Cyberlindnera fabianii]